MAFFEASSVSKMNGRYLDSLFAPRRCPADRHYLWNHYCHLEHYGHHLSLEPQFQPHAAPRVHVRQHAHGNLPQRLPGCLLCHLLPFFLPTW